MRIRTLLSEQAIPASFGGCLSTKANSCSYACLALVVRRILLQEVQHTFAQHGSILSLQLPV